MALSENYALPIQIMDEVSQFKSTQEMINQMLHKHEGLFKHSNEVLPRKTVLSPINHVPYKD